MADDVKVLREAAFACTIRYANTHMSTNDRLYFDAIKICFNRMADMIEREDGAHFTLEEVDCRDRVIANNAWDSAIDAGAGAIKKLLDKFPDGVNPGTYADGQIESLYSAIDALNALRRERRP